jgi:hypothetical protein
VGVLASEAQSASSRQVRPPPGIKGIRPTRRSGAIHVPDRGYHNKLSTTPRTLPDDISEVYYSA